MTGICAVCGTIAKGPKLRCQDCPKCGTYDTLVRFPEHIAKQLAKEIPTARAVSARVRRNNR